MCICVPVYAYMYIYRYRYIACMSRNPLRSGDGVRSPETGTTDDCEQACEYWEVELSLLQDPTPMLISTEPSLKPSTSNFKCEIPGSVGEYLQNTKICKLPLSNTQHMTTLQMSTRLCRKCREGGRIPQPRDSSTYSKNYKRLMALCDLALVRPGLRTRELL